MSGAGRKRLFSGVELVDPASLKRDVRERSSHFLFRRRLQNAPIGEFFCLRISRRTHTVGRTGEVVGCLPQLDVIGEKQPVRARLAERHADTARVDHSRIADHAVVLHVGMTAHDQARRDAAKDGNQPLCRSQPGEAISLAVRSAMTKQYRAQRELHLQRCRPAAQRVLVVR